MERRRRLMAAASHRDGFAARPFALRQVMYLDSSLRVFRSGGSISVQVRAAGRPVSQPPAVMRGMPIRFPTHARAGCCRSCSSESMAPSPADLPSALGSSMSLRARHSSYRHTPDACPLASSCAPQVRKSELERLRKAAG